VRGYEVCGTFSVVEGELTRTRDVVLYTVAWCPLWVGAGGYLPAPPRSTRTYISLRNVIALGDNRSLKTSPPLSVSPLSPSLPLLLLHPCPSFISEYSSSLPNSDDPGLAEWRWACAVLLLVLLLPTGKVRVPPDVLSDYSLQSVSPCAEPSARRTLLTYLPLQLHLPSPLSLVHPQLESLA
jgi:hypothetical protein